MKNYFFIAVFISLSFFCRAEQQVVLDLNGGVTWQEVFEAGLRPSHLSDGIDMCRQYNVDLSIKSISGDVLHLGKGDVDLSVREVGLLVGLSFYGRENRSLEEVRAKSRSFIKMLDGHVTQQAALETFRVKHEVDYSGQRIDPPEIEEHIDLKTTTNAAKVDDFSIIYSFSDSYSDDLPLVERLSVTLQSREAKQAKRLNEKIRPPVGYEHISLEPIQGSDEPEREVVVPESKREQDDARVEQPRQKSGIEREETTAEKPSYFPWIFVVLLLLGILAAFFKVWKDKSGR